MGTKHILKHLIYFFLSKIPSIGRKDLILCWHTVSDENQGKGFVSKSRALPMKSFEKQLKWLSKFVDFVDLSEIVSQTPRNNNRWRVAITFDDGYRDNLYVVLPILEKFKAPCTLFVATAFIHDRTLPWWDLVDWMVEHGGTISVDLGNGMQKFNLDKEPVFFRTSARVAFRDATPQARDTHLSNLFRSTNANIMNAFMSKDELRQFSQSNLISIGAHTHTHVNASFCSNSTFRSEIDENVNYLHSHDIPDISYFAFPYGAIEQVSESAKHILRERGFKAAFTTSQAYFNKMDDIYALPRQIVSPKSNFNEFKSRVKHLTLINNLSL